MKEGNEKERAVIKALITKTIKELEETDAKYKSHTFGQHTQKAIANLREMYKQYV